MYLEIHHCPAIGSEFLSLPVAEFPTATPWAWADKAHNGF